MRIWKVDTMLRSKLEHYGIHGHLPEWSMYNNPRIMMKMQIKSNKIQLKVQNLKVYCKLLMKMPFLFTTHIVYFYTSALYTFKKHTKIHIKRVHYQIKYMAYNMQYVSI